jgi:glycosyltransferase involved in cell wall biosynthesis
MADQNHPNGPIVIVMPLAEQRGGAELALLQLIRAGGDRNWHVVFLEDGPMVCQVRESGSAASIVPAGRLRQPHKMLSAVMAISKIVRQTHARAVLSWMTKGHLYGSPAATLAGVPATWFQHALPSQVMDTIAAHIPSVGAMACSQFIADSLKVAMPKVPVKVVHPGIDPERSNPANLPSMQDCRRMLGLPVDHPVIGIFGRLQKWKGVHVLIDALPTVLKRYPTTKTLIVGGAWRDELEYEHELKQQAASLGIAERIVFAGHQDNVSDWMQACDLIVHASKQEPFGMVVVEAMALGKPIVAGAEGGPREIITEGVNGLLAPFGDSGKLASAIIRFLDDPAFAAAVGNAARQRAKDFSLERFAAGVCDAINNWLDSRSTVRRATCA